MIRLTTLLALLAFPLTAAADIVWRSDFEGGNLAEWDKAQMVSADRLQVVSDPTRNGSKALKVTVKYGDDPINASGNRNELVQITGEKSGSEYYYAWSTMFREDFPAPDTWQLFAQWHHDGCCGSPPVEMIARNGKMMLSVSGRVLWEAPLVRGVWHDFIFRVKWSADAKVGFVELFHNNELVLPKTHAATQYAGYSQYLKLGLYRSDTIREVGVLYHDDFRMATRLEDVLPPPPAEPVEPEQPEEPMSPPVEVTPPPGPTFPQPPMDEPPELESIAVGCSTAGNSAVGGIFVVGLLALLWKRRRLK